MNKVCQQCGYIRTERDSRQAPDWQCPKCAGVYDKAGRREGSNTVSVTSGQQSTTPPPRTPLRILLISRPRFAIGGVLVVLLVGVALLIQYTRYASSGPHGPYIVLMDTTDAPGKVVQKLLVAPDITKADLQTLLQARYEEVRRRSFTYHNHRIDLINVAIYAYPSREHADADQNWIGMLFWVYVDRSPRIKLRSEVGQAPLPDEERFGYTEEQRKGIYKRYVSIEDQAGVEAERRHRVDVEKQIAGYTELANQKKQKLANELALSVDDLWKIGIEGVRKNWPVPKL